MFFWIASSPSAPRNDMNDFGEGQNIYPPRNDMLFKSFPKFLKAVFQTFL